MLLGLGFYGRSFTLKDPACKAPVREFTKGRAPGPCTGTEGIRSGVEIRDGIENKGANVVFDEVAAAKIVTWDDDQWVSYDDAEALN